MPEMITHPVYDKFFSDAFFTIGKDLGKLRAGAKFEIAAEAVGYGQSLARPFARRRLRTFLPFLVAILARNPWVRLRDKTLG